MPDGKKTYKVNGQTYDIPEDKVDAFLSKYPNAQPLESYIVDKDTFDIPTDKVAAFKKKFPNAKPTFGTVKKKTIQVVLGLLMGLVAVCRQFLQKNIHRNHKAQV